MKLSELDNTQYKFDDVSTTSNGGVMSSPIPGVAPLARTGLTFGAEIGKAGLGLGQTFLNASAKVADKFLPSINGKKSGGDVLRGLASQTAATKENIFSKPFEDVRKTTSGKVGEGIGMAVPFFAGTGAINRSQGILQNILEPVSKVRGLGTLTKAATQAIPEAIVTGGTQYGISGGDKESAMTAAKFAGGSSGVLSGLGSIARATFFPELKTSVTRALGIQGKTTGGRVAAEIDKKIAGLSVLNKYAPDIKVKDVDGFEKTFNPTRATFDETLQAWNTARKSIYQEYHEISSNLGKANFVSKDGTLVSTGIDLQSTADELNAVINSPRTAPYKEAARSILSDIVNNFGEIKDGKVVFKKVPPDAVETFLSDLYTPAASFFQGKGDRAYSEIAAGAAKSIRNLMDNAIEGAGGTEYQGLRSEYSALKSIEDDLVRRFQQEARQVGGGLSDYANIFSSGDLIAGLLSQNPALVVKGGAQGILTSIFKALKRPDRYMQRAFKLLDKADGGELATRMFGGMGGRPLSPEDQRIADSVKNYIKNPKLGMSIEDVSKNNSLYQEAKKYKSAEEFVKSQGKPVYRGEGGSNVAQGKALLAEGKHFASDSKYPQGFGTVSEYIIKPNAKVLDLGDSTFAEISQKLGIPERWYISPKELSTIAKEKGYDVLKYNGEYKSTGKQFTHFVDLTGDSTISKSQLTDIWKKTNQATKEVPAYKGETDLTTKILKDLEGKTTVSKQYILDATNRGELKQVERDLIRNMLEGEKDVVNVPAFAKKVKAELLPLKVKRAEAGMGDINNDTGEWMKGRYENITLPEELRGKVKDYRENIYESPIKTSAGNAHFDDSENYFGHTRIEDMADNKTRRVIEVQSDLYQKGNLEKELSDKNMKYVPNAPEINAIKFDKRQSEIAKLQQYNDPTAHFRMVREEIKKAAQDGKTKLQFPTGETAMKIEGLGSGEVRWTFDNQGPATPSELKVGKEIWESDPQIGMLNEDAPWIITDVLGDGKFKAVPKEYWERSMKVEKLTNMSESQAKNLAQQGLDIHTETFDISGKVDTSNPIFKFYEKEMQKYLTKFGGKKVVDDNGVSWIEVPIKKEWAKMPVEAFGLVGFIPTEEK